MNRPPANGAPGVSPSAPVRFEPFSVEAEDPNNLLLGGAGVADCGTCDGGARVRYIGAGPGSLVVHFYSPVGGDRKITVRYESDGRRELKLSVNGGAALAVSLPGVDWHTPLSYDLVADIPPGPVSLKFYNDTTPAPDVDKIMIS